MEILLKEVMLSGFKMLQETNDICFEFYNANTGEDIGGIVCKNVYKFDMSTSFLQEDDKFPCFVLDVTSCELKGNEIIDGFDKMKYAFRNNGKPAIPQSDSYWYFGVEGGPIEIHVISSGIEKKLDV